MCVPRGSAPLAPAPARLTALPSPSPPFPQAAADHEAYEPSQKYKEGKVILEVARLKREKAPGTA